MSCILPDTHVVFLPIYLRHLSDWIDSTKELGGPEIWIKRDDCTGMSTGGNKTRKLEFLMAEAELQGADIVITQGATQLASCAANCSVCRENGNAVSYFAGRSHTVR